MLKSTLIIILFFIIVMIMVIITSYLGFKKEKFGSSDWVGEWRTLSQPYIIYYDDDLYPQYDKNYLKLNYKGFNQSHYQ